MKNIAFFFLMILFFACKEPTPKVAPVTYEINNPVKLTIENFDWLLSDWKRTNNKEGEKTFEYWDKIGDHYEGLSYTLTGQDTTFKEDMKLFKYEESWIFEVSGVGEKPVIFPVVESTEKNFKCFNPDNDFPNTINYQQIRDDVIIATISGNQEAINFLFQKI